MLSGDALGAILEEDWLHFDIERDNNVQRLIWRHQSTP